MGKYNRTVSELQSVACNWWPEYLSDIESSTSIIPMLVKTQDEFISILTLSKDDPEKIFEVINVTGFPANLFLKHLVVLADFGGEQIQRLNRNFESVFCSGTKNFKYLWEGKEYTYKFLALPYSGLLNNQKLHIDGKGLKSKQGLDGLKKDCIMLLLYGANAVEQDIATILAKCEIGSLIGKPDELSKFIKERYIFVSRITGGAQANTLGQVAQIYVVDYLKAGLSDEYIITSNGYIDGVSQNDGETLISFDVVVSKGSKSVAIEVSFQVTTNSTIERKSGQAQARYNILKDKGHYMAYIIDGAGNFQRSSAISTICNFSDCTVAYTQEEFELLIEFIKEKLE